MYKIEKLSASSLFENIVDVQGREFNTVKDGMIDALTVMGDFAMFLLEYEYQLSTIKIKSSKKITVYDDQGVEHGSLLVTQIYDNEV